MTDDRRKAILFAPLSAPGAIAGALLFLASLTPSLIPRLAVAQGALGGISLAAGYAIAVGLAGLWVWLGLPYPSVRRARLRGITLATAAIIGIFALSRAAAWQNQVRAALDMAPVETARPLTVMAVAALVALVLIGIGRMFLVALTRADRLLGRRLPPRLAYLAAFICTATLFWTLGNGVLLQRGLVALDRTYQAVDTLIDPDLPTPADPMKTGSAGSMIGWETLGHEGRNMVAGFPDRAAISAISGRPAKEPLRIYVGLNSADTPVERADLALAEMLRTGAFDRQTLLIATPTGTGWIDPAGLAPAEILAHGDIATVSVQYSYLPSWLTLMVDTGYGAETARAVFAAVYGHWRSLPRNDRPRLFLFGLSLGSVNADAALDLYDVLADPFQGALWAGPPFANASWRKLSAMRNPGTAVWMPAFRDGSTVRFAGPDLPARSEGWGPVRILYLQYPSDPIVFFTEDSFVRRPPLLQGPHGHGVSPGLRWIPVVTGLQLAFDMMTATTVAPGRGHVYAARDYVDGWRVVLDPPGWDDARIGAIKSHLAGLGL